MRAVSKGLVAACIVALGVGVGTASTANAATNFDSDPKSLTFGTGFIGKGDIQTPWGWSDALFQANWSGVTISYKTNTRAVQTCGYEYMDWDGKAKTATQDSGVLEKNTTSIAFTELGKDGRNNKQEKITGIRITGLGENRVVSDIGDAGDPTVPDDGTPCAPTGNVYDPENPNGGGYIKGTGFITAVTIESQDEWVFADYTQTTTTIVGYTGTGKKRTPIYSTVETPLPQIELWKNGVSQHNVVLSP